LCGVEEVERGVETGLVPVSFPCVFGFLSACGRCGERRTRLVGCVLGSEAVGLLEGSCVVLKRWRGGWRQAWFLCLFRVFLVFCRLVEGVGRGSGVGLLGTVGRCGGWRWAGRG
jgi:hypothetical protein